MKSNLRLSVVFLLLASLFDTSCAENLQQQLRKGEMQESSAQKFFSNSGRPTPLLISDYLQKSPPKKRNELLTSLWQEFVDQPNFQTRRVENRIKVDRLKKLLMEYEYTISFDIVASDLLGENYTSLLAHFALMQYHDRRENVDMANFHENIVTILLEHILSSGQGTFYSPYVVSSLAEIEEFLFVGEYNVKGQIYYWTENDKPMVEVLVANKDNDRLQKKYFSPCSINKLEQELAQKLSLEKDFQRYYIMAELALLDPAAQTGMAKLLVDSSAPFYKPKYIESLLERSAKNNALYHDMMKAKYLMRQARETQDATQRKNLTEEVTDLLMSVADKNHADAFLSLYYVLGKLEEYKNNSELLTDLLIKSHELGSKHGSLLLADLYVSGNGYIQKDLLKARNLYLEAFERGLPLAAKYFAQLSSWKTNLSEGDTSKLNEVLDKAIALNSREAILLKAKGLFENEKWTDEDILKGKELLEKLSLFDNTQLELNEMAWIYGTHSSKDVQNLEKAISLIAEARRTYEPKKIRSPLWDTAANILASAGDKCNALAYQRMALRARDKRSTDSETKALKRMLAKYTQQYQKENGFTSIFNLKCGTSVFDIQNAKYKKDNLGYGNGVYEGAVEDGKPHGKGRYYWDDGDRLTGTFNHGLANGLGTYQWGQKSTWKGHIFQGMYVDGMRQGMGLYIWDNGDLHIGEYQNERQTGQGVAIYTNGGRYEGNFDSGVQKGKSSYLFHYGTAFRGETHNDVFQGTGEFFYADGNHYKGEISQNQLNGKGVFTWLSGDTYTGEFKDDQLHGKGICVFDGESHPCQFNKDALVEEKKTNEKS